MVILISCINQRSTILLVRNCIKKKEVEGYIYGVNIIILVLVLLGKVLIGIITFSRVV